MRVRCVNENFKENYGYNLLMSRGVVDVVNYLTPNKGYLQDPGDFENIAEAAELYINKIQNGKNILLVVDSDNDGFTSAAIIYQYSKKINPNIDIEYVLHDGKQHGLEDCINTILDSKKSYELIILPDSSSNDFEYHNQLKEVNIPVLVLDHHITDIQISDNAYVVNNQLSPKYLNKELTGAGVVYQFCRYVDRILNINEADNYIDLAAWGIIGDMGSVLTLENRYIIFEGLKNIKNDFFWALLRKQGYSITGAMSPTDEQIIKATNPISVAFYIVPLVNAVIRAGSMDEKKRMFYAFVDGNALIPSGKRGAKGTLEKAAIESARECTNARNRQNKIKDTAVENLEIKIHKYGWAEHKVLFVELEEEDNFPSELNGLVAMQLSAKFKKPTIVARNNTEGVIKGSARGMNDSELKDFKVFLSESGYFNYAMGHPNAFGVGIPKVTVPAFIEYADKALSEIDFGEGVYNINFQRLAADKDLAALIVDLVSYDGIWGQGSPEPLIHIKDINISPTEISVCGKNSDTVRINKFGITYIKFHAKDLIEQLNQFNEIKMEIIGRANLNEWMGTITPQIIIENYEVRNGENEF